MEYELKPSDFFLQQIDELSDEAKKTVEDKLKLVKINPFRNKRIHGYNLFLFRVRFEDQRREKRFNQPDKAVRNQEKNHYIALLCTR